LVSTPVNFSGECKLEIVPPADCGTGINIHER
jgi:hypothetical protein